ncbi:hypothetical protein NQ318_010304 [Aromia moschata]|uniref:Uncharacterized protein n=1 Tax=Aromia moschata TaxID=1265417 RepID=A0AAV8XRG9_9CUCU|nr:hypothetical protein NQ318_010304 [Aromia moschata]
MGHLMVRYTLARPKNLNRRSLLSFLSLRTIYVSFPEVSRGETINLSSDPLPRQIYARNIGVKRVAHSAALRNFLLVKEFKRLYSSGTKHCQGPVCFPGIGISRKYRNEWKIRNAIAVLGPAFRTKTLARFETLLKTIDESEVEISVISCLSVRGLQQGLRTWIVTCEETWVNTPESRSVAEERGGSSSESQDSTARWQGSFNHFL